MNRLGRSVGVGLTLSLVLLSRVAWGENYTITDINVGGGSFTIAYSLNDAGHATGVGMNSAGQIHPYLYKSGVVAEFRSISGLAKDYSFALGINKFDQIVGGGALDDPTFRTSYSIIGTIWNSSGIPTNLGVLPGAVLPSLAYGYGINDAGEVVGYSSAAAPNYHAFRWKNGVLTALATLGGAESAAYAINNKGQIVGSASEAGAKPDPAVPQFLVQKPVIWENGVATCLCNEVESMEGGAAYAINENGQIVGHCKAWDTDNVEHREAVVWQNGGMLEIGALGGRDGDAWGNNDAGQVVGWAHTAAGVRHAFLWQNGTMIDLNSLIPASSGWILDTAFDINNNGQIVGYGTIGGQTHGFLLNPIVTNKAPALLAGPSANPSTVTLPNTTTVSVSASDPDHGPSPLTYTWSKVSGPGSVSFSPNGTAGSAFSTASFSAAGSYVLRITLYDGAASVTGDVAIVVSAAPNQPPVIDSAPWANPNPVTLPSATTVNVIAHDPDNGPSALTYTWSKVSGPGTVSFSPNGTTGSASSAASFSAAGSYVLRVSVSDGAASVTGDVTVSVSGSSSGTLVGWWKLDEGAGLSAADSSGNNNTATLQTGPTWVSPGVMGGALNFNGGGSANLAASASLNVTSDITMAAWIKTSSSVAGHIIGGYGASPYQGYGFIVNYPSPGQISYWSGAYGAWVSSTSSNYNNGAWHHVAVSVSGSTATFYKDGVADGSVSTARPNAYSGIRALGAAFNGSYALPAILDDVRIYSRALSASEVAALSTVIDATPPTLDVTSITLKGTADGTGSAIVSVTVNGQAAAVTGNTWSKDVNLVTGTNTFSIVITDQGNNQTSKSVSITK